MVILIPFFLLAAFFLLRANPQRRRVQAQQALRTNLRPGTRVVTVAGVIGTLMGIEGDRAAIEVAPGVVVEFLVAAIVRTADDAPAAEAELSDDVDLTGELDLTADSAAGADDGRDGPASGNGAESDDSPASGNGLGRGDGPTADTAVTDGADLGSRAPGREET